MRLATLAVYRDMVYVDGCAPTLVTLRKRVKSKAIPGGRIEAGRYYVDLDENDRVNNLAGSIQSRLDELLNDPLIKAMNKEKR